MMQKWVIVLQIGEKLRPDLWNGYSDSEIVMVDLAFWDDSCKQDRSWDTLGWSFQAFRIPTKILQKFYRVQDAGFIDGSWSW